MTTVAVVNHHLSIIIVIICGRIENTIFCSSQNAVLHEPISSFRISLIIKAVPGLLRTFKLWGCRPKFLGLSFDCMGHGEWATNSVADSILPVLDRDNGKWDEQHSNVGLRDMLTSLKSKRKRGRGREN